MLWLQIMKIFFSQCSTISTSNFSPAYNFFLLGVSSLSLSLSLSLCLSYCLPLTRSLPGQSQRSKHPWGTASSFFGWRTESLQWGSHDPPCALGHTLHSSFLLNHTHVHILKHIFSSFLKMNTNTQSLLHLDVYTFMPVKRWQIALDLMSQLFRKHSPS